MAKNDAILRCLPVIAGVLGRKYGIAVEIGGANAFTDGTTIHLPGLPAQADDIFLGLVRGYIDHEAAHVRETDFERLRSESLSPLTRHVWNIFEDWRVEQRLAAIFPGCRRNFEWLIRHLFVGQDAGAFPVLAWLLLTVRSWSVPDLIPQAEALADRIDADHRGLRPKLEAILSEMAASCPNTAAALGYARQVVDCLKEQSRVETRSPQNRPSGEATSPTKPGDDQANSGNPIAGAKSELQSLLDAGEDQLPADMGEDIRNALRSVPISAERDGMAVEGHMTVSPLHPAQEEACRAASVGLRNRFDGLLQSTRRVRVRPGRRGALAPALLHRVAISDPRLFLRREEKPALNTAVHLLLDASGSMQSRIDLASEACYALALALHQARISVGITAFPGESLHDASIPTVAPILRHGQRPTIVIQPLASGGTPLGEALWWLIPRMQALSETRKIVVIITDGCPDDPNMVRRALAAGRALGIEFIGLGIATPAIADLMPGSSGTIDRLTELMPILIETVQRTVLRTNK